MYGRSCMSGCEARRQGLGTDVATSTLPLTYQTAPAVSPSFAVAQQAQSAAAAAPVATPSTGILTTAENLWSGLPGWGQLAVGAGGLLLAIRFMKSQKIL